MYYYMTMNVGGEPTVYGPYPSPQIRQQEWEAASDAVALFVDAIDNNLSITRAEKDNVLPSREAVLSVIGEKIPWGEVMAQFQSMGDDDKESVAARKRAAAIINEIKNQF